ncbi:glutamate receptor 2-like [Penaeus indicus]|uniref:glutamate receptor 2-like n=1 Tax=Penaeus indicus TaxID=29960 RepID=UPI00300BFF9A
MFNTFGVMGKRGRHKDYRWRQLEHEPGSQLEGYRSQDTRHHLAEAVVRSQGKDGQDELPQSEFEAMKPTVFEFPEGVGAGGLARASGYAAVLVREFQQLLNFSDVLVPTNTFGSEKPNGSWTGMVGALTRFEADFAPLDFTPVYERALAIDFSVIYNTDNVIILTKAPSVAIRPFLLLQIFSPFVWLSLFMGTVTTGAVVGWLLRARSMLGLKKEPDLRSVLAYCAASLKMIVFNELIHSSSSTWWPVWTGGRIVSGAVMFLAVIAGALYGGSITAFLAIPFRTKPLNSLEDLLASDTLPAFRFGASPYNFFVKQTEGVLGDVSQRMRIFTGEETAEWSFMKTVADGTHAFIDTWSSVVGRANLFEERGQPCRFHLGRNPVRMDLDAFGFPKNSPIKYQFDEIMRWFRSYGIIQNIMKKYYAKSCDLLHKVDGPRPLSLIQMQGAFYVMAVGITVSFAAFVGEFIPSRVTNFDGIVFRSDCETT